MCLGVVVNSCSSKYIAGHDPRSFKSYEIFAEVFAKLSSAEINVDIDESGH